MERSVRSILKQTYSHFEFLICQYNSTTSACELLESLQKEDGRIRLIDGTSADTLAQKLNRCLKEAKGTLIARQDDDDYSQPARLERQVYYLSNNPGIAFVGCEVRLMQGKRIVGMYRFPERPIVRDFLFTQPFIHPTLVFYKNVLNAVDGYCEENRCDGCEDYDLLLRLYERGYMGANIQHPYFIYTIPDKGKTNGTIHRRINEMKTRFVLFRRMGLLPKAFPYVCKPVLVGLIPSVLLDRLKVFRRNTPLGKDGSVE
ncbi:glycosyltransferase [Oscillospiraceae bacterium MB08-C2-2]|nr:glycosyltransferase [Oscillospiraceae bacterium MB08-C2-2]